MAVLPKKGEVRIWLALFLFLFAFNISKIEAATCTWIGGTDLNASTAANWSSCSGSVPQSTDDVVINATSDEISWDGSAPATVNSLTLGASFTGTTTLARALTVTTDIAVNGGALNTGTQNLTIQGGDFTVASGKTATSSSSGTVTMQGTGILGGAGIMTLANLIIGNSTTLSASTTLGGNVSIAGNCAVKGGLGFGSPSVIFGLASYQLSCLGSLDVLSNNFGGNVTFNAQNGTLSVLATTTVKSNSGLNASIVTFDGGMANLSFGALEVDSLFTLPSDGQPYSMASFSAGTSGSLTVTSSTTIKSGYFNYSAKNLSIFDGGGKTITFSGPVQITTADTGVLGAGLNGTYFNAGTSGSITFGGQVIVDSSSVLSLASTTFNGQAKNLVFNGGLTLQMAGATAGDVLYTPSTGTNTIIGNFNFLDSSGSTSDSSLVWADPSSAYNMSITGDMTLANGAGSALFDFSPGVGTTTFSGASAQAVNIPSGTVFNNMTISNTGSSTVTFSNSATTTNLFITQGTLVSGANTIGVTGVYKNTAGTAGTTWTGGTLYLSGTSQTITGADTYATLQIGANTDIRMNGSSASTYTVNSTGSLYSTDHAGVDGELYIWGDYHTPTSGTIGSSSYSSDFWSYATDFDGTSLSGGSERQVKVYIASGATVNVENVAGVGPKRLKIIGTATYPTLITRQGGSGYYTFKVDKGRLHANYFHFDYLDTSGLQITNAGVVGQLDNGVFDNGQSGGSFITISNATTTLVANNVTFNNTGNTATYNVTASGGGVNWRFDTSAGTFDGDAYDAPSLGASILWDDDAVTPTAPTVLSATSVRWNFTDNSGSEKAFSVFDTNRNFKLTPSVIYRFSTGTITLGYIGDSLTSGVTGFTNASPTSDFLTDNGTDGYPSQVDALLDAATEQSVQYYNGAIGGWSAGDWVATISGGVFAPITFNNFYATAPDSGHLHENPDIVLILLGTNDLSSVSATTYKTYIADIVSGVIARGGIPFLSYVPPYYTNESSGAQVYQTETEAYNAKLVELAGETGAYIGPDIYSAMKNYTTLLGQSAMYNGAVHFEELGFSAIANEWMNTLMLTGGNTTATPNISSLTETGLTPNTQYSRVIYPMNVAGLNSPATTSSVYTLAAVPTDGSASRSGSSVTVSWSSNNNPAGTEYFVTNTTDGTTSGWITTTNTTFSNAGTGALSFSVKARNAENIETEDLSISLAAGSTGGAALSYGGGGGGGGGYIQSFITPNPLPSVKTPSPSNTSLVLPTISGPFAFDVTTEQVKILQQYLAGDKTLYPEGKITGYYGALTKKAVGLFQERYGLATKKDDFYGLAGPKTRAKMNEVWAGMRNTSTSPSTEAVIELLRAQIKALQEKINLLLSQKTSF
jgi:lysophospholipase L1-like esterase